MKWTDTLDIALEQCLVCCGGGGLAAAHFGGLFPRHRTGDAPVDPEREDFRHGR